VQGPARSGQEGQKIPIYGLPVPKDENPVKGTIQVELQVVLDSIMEREFQ
jgi:hypothetical protein